MLYEAISKNNFIFSERLEMLTAEYPCIKKYNLMYKSMGTYVIQLDVKENEYIMDSLGSNSLSSRLNEGIFDFGYLAIIKIYINLIRPNLTN